MAPRASGRRLEYGDFQTPEALAVKALELVRRLGVAPKAVVEATCGRGAFVLAADAVFPGAAILAVEVNADHLDHARQRLTSLGRLGEGISLRHGDVFAIDWPAEIAALPDPLLITGNYPWVTSAALGAVGSANRPPKSNPRCLSGLDALTGKSNFDISEWLLRRNLDWLAGREGVIAVLCKMAVARKILAHVWKTGLAVRSASLHRIDAGRHFGAAVEAGLFVLEIGAGERARACPVFDDLDAERPATIIGHHDGVMVSNVDGYLRHQALAGRESHHVWRSGIKHDCVRVMELTRQGAGYVNGAGVVVDIEDAFLYPMMKSSDLAGRGGARDSGRARVMLVPQRAIGAPTAPIAATAGRTWRYLTENAPALAARASVVYRGKPEFSIFGVGAYTFAPWKVAISGFYKSLDFKIIGPLGGKPVVFDDTVYFLACASAEEAAFLHALLLAEPVRALLDSLAFWSDKRPITAELLRRIDLEKVARHLGRHDEYLHHRASGNVCVDTGGRL